MSTVSVVDNHSEELLTVEQAAALLHLDKRTIRNYINGSRLPARKLTGGKSWLIRRSDLFAALEDRPGVVAAGTNPMQIAPEAGILRRTQTAEGREKAIAALRALRAGDAHEQTESWNTLKTALDRDRLLSRPLFPGQELLSTGKPK